MELVGRDVQECCLVMKNYFDCPEQRLHNFFFFFFLFLFGGLRMNNNRSEDKRKEGVYVYNVLKLKAETT